MDDILKEYEHVPEISRKGRERSWGRFEGDYAGVTVHRDWYEDDRGDHVLGAEDDASGYVSDVTETARS